MGGLQAFQYHIKQKVDKAFAEKELQTIVLPENEVNWYEQGKEIMVNGKMFDLKAYSICKGVFTAIGVYDEEETGGAVEVDGDDDDDNDDDGDDDDGGDDARSQRQNCNQGIGNGAEGCDPGNSQPRGGSNDEGGRTPGARP